MRIVDNWLTGKKPPDEIILIAKFKELKDLTPKIFKIINIEIVIPEYNKKILIVDDDANTRDILERALKDSGYEPFLAKDGKEGLANLEKKPALIVLDLEMPRMDGFEFLENFVDMDFEDRPNILVYSGKDLSEVQEDLLRKNVAGLVKKDEVSINQLPGMVTKLLGSKA